MIIIHGMNNPQELPRLLEASLTRALRSFPIVVLTGSRQTGKSTLVQGFPGEERIYRTLDDLEILDRARHQPDALVAGERPITLDEVQRSPDLLLAVKRAVDNDRRTGRFLLTGSANLLLMQRISESLAGRAVYLTLWPLTRRELAGYGTAGAWDRLFTTAEREWPGLLAAETAPREDWRALALRGGYPVPAYDLATAEDRAYWFAGYAQTYLERDLQELSAITALVDFRRLMRACCLRLGGLVQQTELGRDVGIPQPTVHRHLAVLETSYQLVRLPPYSVNRTKRLIKTPKLYWCDTGLALHLAGEREPRGAHLENLILCDLLAFRDAQIDRPELLFWRTSTGEEVDLVIEWQGRLLPIEVKASTRPQLADARGLLAFRAEYPEQTLTGLVLHAGSEIEWLAPGVLAAPWWRVI
jgi:predicted AAA+ superfamily ATPase